MSDANGATLRPHGVLLLSRLPIHEITLCRLPSRKDRKLLLASVDTGHDSISVGNLHLESSSNNQLLRLAQLKRVLSHQSSAEHALLMGDFSFDHRSDAEQRRLGRNYIDLWRALCSGADAGHTVDSSRNRMRFAHKFKHKHVRFDRILLRSRAPGWAPRSIRLLGTEPISPATPDTDGRTDDRGPPTQLDGSSGSVAALRQTASNGPVSWGIGPSPSVRPNRDCASIHRNRNRYRNRNRGRRRRNGVARDLPVDFDFDFDTDFDANRMV